MKHVIRTMMVLILAGHAVGQRLWIVDLRNGPGTNFTEIQPAIDAAAPNDVIHVLHRAPSSFTGYAGFLMDKPLKILGISEFSGVNDIGTIPIMGLVEVRGIPAGSEVVLSALLHHSASPLSAPPWVAPWGLWIHDCAGRVHVEAVSAWGDQYNYNIFSIERCAEVSFHGGRMSIAGIPLTVNNSSVRFATMTLQADSPMIIGYPYYVSTQTEALRVENSTVHLTDVIVWGADYHTINGFQFLATPGIVVTSGTVYAGPFTASRGGYFNGMRDYGGVTTGTGQIVTDPRAVMTHPPNAAVTTRYLCAAEHTFTQHNTPYYCRVIGRPGSIGLLAVGSYQTPGIALPGLGLLHLDPNAALTLGIGAMTTQYSYLEFQPTVYGGMPMDHLFAFQGALLHSDGTFELTGPDPFHILWAPGTSYP